jgi:hypothetical protein
MSGTGAAGPELLEGGGPERPAESSGRLAVAGWLGLRGFVQTHRRPVAWAVAGLAVAGWVGLRWYGDRPPPTPDVLVSADRSADSVPLWSVGGDGRPGSAVTLSVAAQLSLPDPRPGDPAVTAIGLAGPGLTSPGVFPHRALGRVPRDFDLTGQVDCDKVPIPLPPSAYQVKLAFADGSRTTLATVPLRAASAAVSRRITYGCSTWLAARDLTVTAVRSTVDPRQPHVDLTLTVTNRGNRDGLLWLGDLTGTGIRTAPLQRVVPAHRATTVALAVDMATCPSWSQTGRPVTATDTPVPLLAAVGVTQPLPADAVPLSQGPTGVVLTPVVAGQLQDAMVAACGGVATPVLLTQPGSSRYDAKSRVLTTRVLVDLPPGVVGSVRFRAVADSGSGIVPLFSSSPWLVPDHSGQAGRTVRFSVPSDVICLGGGPYVAMDVLLNVPGADGTTRSVTFQLFAETLLPQDELNAACDRPGG